MRGFRSRMRSASSSAGPLVLACDYDDPALAGRAPRLLRQISDHACALKLNMHLLLPLGAARVRRLTSAAADSGMLSIADIKLNDIGSTNSAAASRLWEMGFDALIANPSMGPEALAELSSSARRAGRGVIALCHMSSPSARRFYDMRAGAGRVHDVFLKWASEAGADGVVVGATFPRIIEKCKKRAPRMPVYSPGVGAQGGDPAKAREAGADYLIAGRSLLSSDDPRAAAAALSM